jgi:hypothetical protein
MLKPVQFAVIGIMKLLAAGDGKENPDITEPIYISTKQDAQFSMLVKLWLLNSPPMNKTNTTM